MKNEDRLSSLPDEILVLILSCMDTKYAVQTSLVSPRWKLLWTLVPCLNFSSKKFRSLHKFAKFMNNVLSYRNHETELSSVTIDYHGRASRYIVRDIANYAFTHNVQKLTIINPVDSVHKFPPCLFNSQSLKHLALRAHWGTCRTPKIPWDFPALTTMHLSQIALCTSESEEPLDIFSKCVNLKNLTLESFFVRGVKVFDIISPRLTNLILKRGGGSIVNVIAPQLESLKISHCKIKYLNAPAGVSSFCYRGHHPPQLPKDRFHSLDQVKVKLRLYFYCPSTGYDKGDAIEIINMLQELRSARYLTLNLNVVECLSSFPNLVSHLPSPFSNLICVKIDNDIRYKPKVEFSSDVRKFLIDNSPDATFIMEKSEVLSSG